MDDVLAERKWQQVERRSRLRASSVGSCHGQATRRRGSFDGGRDVAIWMQDMIEIEKLGTGDVSVLYPSFASFCFGDLLLSMHS